MKVNVAQSCLTLCDPMDCTVHASLQARILEWVAFPFFRVFSNPGIEPRSPTLQGDFFYQLRHKGSPRTLEWVAYPFSSGSSWTRNQTGVSCIAGRIFTNWAIIHENLSFLSLISLLTLVQKALILSERLSQGTLPFFQSLFWIICWTTVPGCCMSGFSL